VRYVPKAHHSQAIEFIVDNPAVACFMVPGIGKTGIVLHAFKYLKEAGEVERLLVAAPSKVISWRVWQDEVEKWELPFTIGLAGKGKYDIMLMSIDGFDKYCKKRKTRKGKIVIAGIEADKLRALNCDMLCLDESSKIKNYTAQRTNFFIKAAPLFKRRVILSGTPVPRNYQDLFSQYKFLDGGKTLGVYITQYRNAYFYPCGYKLHDYKLKDDADKQIAQAVSHMTVSFGNEYLDLPPLVPVVRRFNLPVKARAEFKTLDKKRLLIRDDQLIVPKNAAARIMKLMQVATGQCYGRDVDDNGLPLPGESILKFHSEKESLLKELVDELQGAQLVVAYNFGHELTAIEKVLKGVDYGVLNAATTNAQERRLYDKWQSGQLQVLIGHIVSIGYGLNLQSSGCCNILIYSLGYNLETIYQCVRRVWRTGQDQHTFVYYFVANDTLDDLILETLLKKDIAQEEFMKSFSTQDETVGIETVRAFLECYGLDLATFSRDTLLRMLSEPGRETVRAWRDLTGVEFNPGFYRSVGLFKSNTGLLTVVDDELFLKCFE